MYMPILMASEPNQPLQSWLLGQIELLLQILPPDPRIHTLGMVSLKAEFTPLPLAFGPSHVTL